MIRVVIGTEPNQYVPQKVLEYSIRTNTDADVDIRFVHQSEKRMGGTNFGFVRFHVPEIFGFEGRAIYLDADQLVLGDIAELLEEFGLTRLGNAAATSLSGGERRRVEIARALASRPDFVLLDEPFAGIDPIAVADIQALVRHLTERGIGVLITDHNVRETLGLIDRATIIVDGEVLTEGTPSEIVEDPDVRRLYLGERFRL